MYICFTSDLVCQLRVYIFTTLGTSLITRLSPSSRTIHIRPWSSNDHVEGVLRERWSWPARVSGQRLNTMQGLLFLRKRNTTMIMSCDPDIKYFIAICNLACLISSWRSSHYLDGEVPCLAAADCLAGWGNFLWLGFLRILRCLAAPDQSDWIL